MLTVLLSFAAGCATPIGPTGGPPDREGPEVLETYPAAGTTNFDDNKVRFGFNEFIDRNSFRQNVSIEPDLGIEFEVGFGRKTATVSFTDPLPENTTIIVKVGTEVTDTNGNELAGSFDLALSTGDVLDDGKVTAEILEAGTGEKESGRRVFLYREPVDFSARANYIAETDTSGVIEFGYLSEGTYRAIWVDDVNRNRTWERNRESAQPFGVESFELGKGEEVDLGMLYVALADTVTPKIDGVGLLTEDRLRLRLSEEVLWGDQSSIVVTDTLGNEVTRATPLYISESDPTILFAQSEDALPESEMFTLRAEGITDFSNNLLEVNFSPFTGSGQPDTTAFRTILHNAGSGLFPDEPLEITYSKFIDDDTVVDSLTVVEGDQLYPDWERVETDRHKLRIYPRNLLWGAGIRYQFRVWNPWAEEREQIDPEIWQRNDMGGIELVLEDPEPDATHFLSLTDRDGSILVDTTFTDTVLVENLPPLEYQAVVFADVNANGRWDAGSVDPYEKPEPYLVRNSVPVREGFTSELLLRFSGREPGEDTEPEEEEMDINSGLDQADG